MWGNKTDLRSSLLYENVILFIVIMCIRYYYFPTGPGDAEKYSSLARVDSQLRLSKHF